MALVTITWGCKQTGKAYLSSCINLLHLNPVIQSLYGRQQASYIMWRNRYRSHEAAPRKNWVLLRQIPLTIRWSSRWTGGAELLTYTPTDIQTLRAHLPHLTSSSRWTWSTGKQFQKKCIPSSIIEAGHKNCWEWRKISWREEGIENEAYISLWWIFKSQQKMFKIEIYGELPGLGINPWQLFLFFWQDY